VAGSSPSQKRLRQRHVVELVHRQPIGSQAELVDALRRRGLDVTQATVSRDIAELGLLKALRAGRHVYVSPDDLAPSPERDADQRLARMLADTPVTVGRSALTLVLRGPLSSAQALARAIDESSLRLMEGTLGGDDTVLVLFADEERLTAWLERFRGLQGGANGHPGSVGPGRPQAVAGAVGRERSSGPT
jgi:transcriptional regulator of arginine metabolism